MQTSPPANVQPIAPTPATPASSPVKGSRWVAVAALLGLIILGLAWELTLAPLRPGGSWLALKVVPLCIPIAGLLKNRMYTYRWVSLVIWLYFIEGVVRAWGDKTPGNLLAMLEVALCIVLFAACTVHIRIRQRDALAALAREPATAASP